MCGKNLMEETGNGVYIGPRDTDEEQSDVHVKFNETHLTIIQFGGERKLELSKESAVFLQENQKAVLEGIWRSDQFSFSINLNPASSLRITNKDVIQEMCDLRIWYKNCVGRWAPTRKGARLHYIHVINLFVLIEEFLKV